MDIQSQERERELWALKLRLIAIIAVGLLSFDTVPFTALMLAISFGVVSSVLAFVLCGSPQTYYRLGRNFTGTIRFIDLPILLAPVTLSSAHSVRIWMAAAVVIFAEAASRRTLNRLVSLTLIGLIFAAVSYSFRWVSLENCGWVSSLLVGSALCSALLLRVAHHEDALGQNFSRLQAMISCSTKMVSEGDIRTILAEILKSSVIEVGATAGYVMLVDQESGQQLMSEVAFSTKGEFAFPKKLKTGEGLSGQVVQKNQPIALQSNGLDGAECDGNPLGSQVAICVPISARGLFRNSQATGDQTLGSMTVIGNGLSSGDMPFLCSVASLMSVSISNSRIEGEQRSTFFTTLEGIATALEARDEYTTGHSARVCQLSLMLAKSLGFSQDSLNELRLGAILHDIGKIGVPDSIVNKKGRLTDEELVVMKTYPLIGYEICKPLRLNEGVLMIIRNHHEKLDGTGYPDGLRGGELPPLLRIVCVADAFDAMSSYRPYREVLKTEEVFVELSKSAGVHFDPIVVEALRDLLGTEKFQELYRPIWERGIERAA